MADYKPEFHFFMIMSQLDRYEQLKYIRCLPAAGGIEKMKPLSTNYFPSHFLGSEKTLRNVSLMSS